MQKLICPCGHAIVLSVIPADAETAYFPTTGWDELVGALAEAAVRRGTSDVALLGEALSDTLATRVSYFYRCPVCDRLSFPGRGVAPTHYRRE